MLGQILTLAGVILLSGFLSNIFGKRNVFLICLSLTALFTVQTPRAIEGITLTSSLIPAVTFAVGVIALFFYRKHPVNSVLSYSQNHSSFVS
jgi:Na+/melibiose symporter-like transporter